MTLSQIASVLALSTTPYQPEMSMHSYSILSSVSRRVAPRLALAITTPTSPHGQEVVTLLLVSKSIRNSTLRRTVVVSKDTVVLSKVNRNALQVQVVHAPLVRFAARLVMSPPAASSDMTITTSASTMMDTIRSANLPHFLPRPRGLLHLSMSTLLILEQPIISPTTSTTLL
jgi:hypothetical protein